MGLHRLEIGLTDELLSRIDRVSTQTNHTRTEVVIETLEDHLPEEVDDSQAGISARKALLDDIVERGSKLGSGRSQEDIDRQIREFRGDR
ncbi:hypothetical protein [Rhizobium sp. LCM 4573]|uniref:hypothetical protein n=1 Tax=Rhizobium sp. LCM 4573 TaxID=1848291 RepID=UPI00104203DD|nr:hypothetical protein [Rhizobium sp. LCM 4573]